MTMKATHAKAEVSNLRCISMASKPGLLIRCGWLAGGDWAALVEVTNNETTRELSARETRSVCSEGVARANYWEPLGGDADPYKYYAQILLDRSE